MNKVLFLFTVNYPFSTGEHLIEYELEFLNKYFDKIVIFCSDIHSEKNFSTPDSIEIIRYSAKLNLIEKLLSFKYIFSKLFRDEIKIINNSYKRNISLELIKTIIMNIQVGKKVSKILEKMMKDFPKSRFFYYSWWTTEATLGFSILKLKYPHIVAVTRARAVDLYFERHKSRYLPLRVFIYNQLDAIFCISNEGVKYISNRFEQIIDTNKIHIGRMGTIKNDNKSKIKLVSTKSFRIVSCSNIIELKRINLIIDALNKINDISIEWIHFGDGDLKDKIIQLAHSKLQGKTNIDYLFKGYVSNKKIMEYYAENHIDLFINVSKYEGVPVSIMEANSYSIPAIATDVGGVSEMVTGKTGYLLPVDVTSDKIANTIREFFTLDIDSRNIIRNNAYNHWENHYNAKKNFTEISQQISQILGM